MLHISAALCWLTACNERGSWLEAGLLPPSGRGPLIGQGKSLGQLLPSVAVAYDAAERRCARNVIDVSTIHSRRSGGWLDKRHDFPRVARRGVLDPNLIAATLVSVVGELH